MNRWYIRVLKNGMLGFLLCISLAAGGCEGTDTRDKVDNTVEEMAGKKDLDHYQQMKDDLGRIQKQQTERNRQMNEDAE